MIDDNLSEEALKNLENREALAKAIREQQTKAAEGVVEVDKTYADLLKWWRKAKPHFVERADANNIEMGRVDAVAIVMYNIANSHPATDIALMLAAKIVDEEAGK